MSHRRDPFESFHHSCGEDVHSLPQAFQATAAARPDGVALADFDTGLSLTWKQYAAATKQIATGLDALSIASGDAVALLLTNRHEFHLVDTAVLHLGGVPFSIYATLPPDQVEYICNNAAAACIVTERRFMPLLHQANLGTIRVVCVDGPTPGAISLSDIMTLRCQDFDFEATWRSVRPSDLATIIYTSGTTGQPKGVELTHSNVLAQLNGIADSLPTGYDDSIVSYLPAAHIADRVTTHYAGMVRGVQVTCLADAGRLGEALPRIRPTVVFGVPRVWQKIHTAIRSTVDAEPVSLRIRLARWALRVAEESTSQDHDRATARHRLAELLVLRRIRRSAGLDRVRFAATGAATIPQGTLEFFYNLGVAITEVWGLSEGAGVSTTTIGPRPAFGSVGRPVPGVEIELAHDGEILLRGPMIMKGYRGDPIRTQASFDRSGWLLTGDLGRFDHQGDLHLIGRKSEMMINDSGRNISPTQVEGAITSESFLIGHVVAVGDSRPYVTALITLDAVAIDSDAQASGVIAADLDVLATRPSIRRLITEAVQRGNRKLARVEQVKRFMILDHGWVPGSAEVTPKLSLRRNAIHRNYAWEIAALYADSPDPRIIDV